MWTPKGAWQDGCRLASAGLLALYVFKESQPPRHREKRPLIQVLQSERLRLTPRVLADLPANLEMDLDAEVMRYVGGPIEDASAHEAYLRSRITAAFPPGLGCWSLRERRESAPFLGWVVLAPHELVPGEIEIGWRLRRESWGRGFATEAARRLLDHGFDELGLEEIVADIHPENLASIRVAEKIGLRRHEDREVYEGPSAYFKARRESSSR